VNEPRPSAAMARPAIIKGCRPCLSESGPNDELSHANGDIKEREEDPDGQVVETLRQRQEGRKHADENAIGRTVQENTGQGDQGPTDPKQLDHFPQRRRLADDRFGSGTPAREKQQDRHAAGKTQRGKKQEGDVSLTRWEKENPEQGADRKARVDGSVVDADDFTFGVRIGEAEQGRAQGPDRGLAGALDEAAEKDALRRPGVEENQP
jgi:hypothetical protein